MDAIKNALNESKRNSEAMKVFGYRLRNKFFLNESFRRSCELKWLEDLRQIKGIYDPDVIIDNNASKVFPKVTRAKVNIVLSRLVEMLFPETDKNWEIEPTPNPKIPEATVKQIIMSLMQKSMMETQIAASEQQNPAVQNTPQAQPPSVEEVRMAINDYCDEACKQMSIVIDDQLTEMDYAEETKKVLRSGLTYGTGIMKGPMVNKRTKHIWEPGEDGEYLESQDKEDVPYFEFVRIWDWYPDMTVTDSAMMEGSWYRRIMTKHDLRQLIKRDDYFGDLITEYLESHQNGDYVPKNWEVDLQVIELQARSSRSSTPSTTIDGSSSMNYSSNANNPSTQMGSKYEVLDFWGYVDGYDLECCGINVDDVTLEYGANVILLGGVPIKCTLFDGALNQYKLFYYEKDETSIYGEGLCRVMRHSALAIGAGSRMVLDNGAIVSGPIVEMNLSLIEPNSDIDSIYPRQIIYRTGRGVDAQYPAVRNINIDSHIPELIKIVDFFKQFADEETCLPTWMMGQMVNNETAQATSGRQATITISIKDIVKNFDSFTEGNIRDLYAWNMEFNPRPDIKGDFSVKARGVSSLVMKEIRMQALSQLATTMSDEDWVYLDRREFLKQRLDAHDINVKLKTEEEADKIREAQQSSEMNVLQIELLKSEISKNRAQAMTNLTKAKKINVEANKDASTPPEQPESADPRLADEQVALSQTDRMRKEAEIRRGEEKHQMELAHADENHNVKKAIDTTKAIQDISLKGKKTEAEIKAKETVAKQKKASKPKKSEG